MAGNEVQEMTPEQLMQRMQPQPQVTTWDGRPGVPAQSFEELESQKMQLLQNAVIEVNDDLQRHKKATLGFVAFITIAVLLLGFFK
jgi:hypothetical protein